MKFKGKVRIDLELLILFGDWLWWSSERVCTYISSAILTDTGKMDENRKVTPAGYKSFVYVCAIFWNTVDSTPHFIQSGPLHTDRFCLISDHRKAAQIFTPANRQPRWKVKTCADCRYYQMNQQTLFVIFSFPLVCVRVSYRECVYI